jgi:hypothetical protein
MGEESGWRVKRGKGVGLVLCCQLEQVTRCYEIQRRGKENKTEIFNQKKNL